MINNTKETNSTQTDVIDRTEAARVLGVSCTQIERFRRAGKLPHIKLARKCIRYRRSDCEKLLQACTISAGANNG